VEIISDLQKVMRILSSQISHATYLPLAPERSVSVIGRHIRITVWHTGLRVAG
jgi:hypothetical protein